MSPMDTVNVELTTYVQKSLEMFVTRKKIHGEESTKTFLKYDKHVDSYILTLRLCLFSDSCQHVNYFHL